MTLIIGERPFDFFLQEFGKAVNAEHVVVSPHAQVYLAGVLERHMTSAWHPGEVLGFRIIEVLREGAGSPHRAELLRELGDIAWVVSGLYPEYRGDLRNLNYHMAMGWAAYHRLGGEPFTELARHFRGLVDALMRFGAEHAFTSDRDILRLYELWRETGSRRIARLLADQGLMPVHPIADSLS